MLLSRLSHSLRRAGSRYAELSTQHPHKVAGATAVTVMGTADVVCQSFLQYDPKVGWDRTRTAGVVAFAGWHYGGPCKFLYLKYDELVPKLVRTAGEAARSSAGWVRASSASAAMGRGGGLQLATPGRMVHGRNVSTIAARRGFSTAVASHVGGVLARLPPRYRAIAMTVFLDVGIHTPFLLVPTFYMFTGMAKYGVSVAGLASSVAQLRREWVSASFGLMLFWTPVCAGNFAVVPQHSRILFVTAMGFLSSMGLSWFANSEEHARKRSGQEQATQEAVAFTDVGGASESSAPSETSTVVSVVPTEVGVTRGLAVVEERFGSGVAARVPQTVLFANYVEAGGASDEWASNPQDGGGLDCWVKANNGAKKTVLSKLV